MTTEGGVMYEQGNNLARECREFYEKRVVMVEKTVRHWQAVEACSEKVYGTIRRNRAGTIEPRIRDELEPFARLPQKISQLRKELLSLVNLDNELFKHLLTLNDTIEDLRERTNPKFSAPTTPSTEVVDMQKKPVVIPTRVEEEEEEEPEVENFEWPLSLEEAHMFASLPVDHNYNNNYTKTLPNTSRRRRMAEQEETSGAMKFVLRSKSFLMRQPFQRKHISFPASKQNRRKPSDEPNENQTNTETFSTNGKNIDLSSNFSAMNLGTSGSGQTIQRTPLFNLPPSRFLWQKMFFTSSGSQSNGPESLPANWFGSDDGGFKSLSHMKQNSFDSGIHTTSESEYSVKV